MPTDITNSKVPITTDDDFFWTVKEERPAVVSIFFETPGSGGTVTIKDAQGTPYRNEDDSADLTVANTDTVNKYNIDPTGGRFNFTTSGVAAGSASVIIRVINQVVTA